MLVVAIEAKRWTRESIVKMVELEQIKTYLFFGAGFIAGGLAITVPANRAGFFFLFTHHLGCKRDDDKALLLFVFIAIVVMDCFWMCLCQNYEKRGVDQNW
jgi:hypothetical protein